MRTFRWNKFPWGKVMDSHQVGSYEVIQYQEYKHSNVHPKEYTGRILYHVFVDGEDGQMSCPSLEEALIHGFAVKHAKDHHAHRLIAKMLDLPKLEEVSNG